MGTTDAEEVKNSLYSTFLSTQLIGNNNNSQKQPQGLEVYLSDRASISLGRGPGIGPSTTKINKQTCKPFQ